MTTPYQRVRAFQKRFTLPCLDRPMCLPANLDRANAEQVLEHLVLAQQVIRTYRHEDDQLWGRVQMMIEELAEFVEAARHQDLPGMADALVDLEYFALGTAAMMGLPHDEVFAAVHAANMAKVPCESSAESRRLNKLDVKKPADWRPPDVAGLLRAAAERADAVAMTSEVARDR